jgi:hypothetical protein
MSYAILNPDNETLFKVESGDPLPDNGRTLLERGLLPVDETIPEGKQQDFQSGKDGWYIEGKLVKPCLKDIPQPLPPQVPFAIQRFKLRLWLNSKGILQAVESMLNDATKWPDKKAQTDALILWNERPDVRRDSVLVNSLGAALGMSPEQIDAAFIAADSMD